MEPIDFTPTESQFIHKTLDGYNSPNFDIKMSMIRKIINSMLQNPTLIISQQARDVIEQIQLNICMYQATEELHKILIDPNYENKANYQSEQANSIRVASLNAIRPHTAYLYLKILDQLNSGNLTRRELSERTGIRLSSVCARVNELIKDNLVSIYGTKWDSETNRNVELVGRT